MSKLDKILTEAKAIKVDGKKWDDMFYLTDIETDKQQIKALILELIESCYQSKDIVELRKKVEEL